MQKLMTIPFVIALLGAGYYCVAHSYELYYEHGVPGVLFLTWLASLVAAVIYFDPRD